MKEYKFVKEFDEGVKRIYLEMKETGLAEPSFKKIDFMTVATLKNGNVTSNVGQNVGQEMTIKIIELLRSNFKIKKGNCKIKRC